MTEASIPAAAMPAATGVHSSIPAAHTKLQGGTPGASAPTAATFSTILGTSLALDQIHKVGRWDEDIGVCE
jgi:hypothetical protein